jgi:hypothetical protein
MKTSLSLQGSLRVLLVGAVVVILTGCVGVMPVPVSAHVEYGQKLQSKQVVCIRPGHTTRAEVIAALGTNYATFRSIRSIAYTWELSGGGGVWWIGFVNGGTTVTWVGGWRGFLIAFDELDVVRAAEFKKLSARRSLDDNMERWVAKLPPAPPLGTAGVEVVLNPLPAPQR